MRHSARSIETGVAGGGLHLHDRLCTTDASEAPHTLELQGASRRPSRLVEPADREADLFAMSSTDRLSVYRTRRAPDRSPEPFGEGTAVAGAGRFCVQKHAASRTHYDLRLEMDGVLKSWAVPKGVSLDPREKRLAVLVEDHPLEYAEFEGVIPEGEYGAGPVVLWDAGRWRPLSDPDEGLASGKLLFELQGYKLRGVWTLVRLEKGETGNEWLLIRERRAPGGRPDGVESGEADELPEQSVLSGLTVEELGARAAGRLDPGRALGAEVERLAHRGARRRVVEPTASQFMLARTRKTPFSDPEWVFELKLDGYRMLAGRRDGGASLLTRGGHDISSRFPELARVLEALPFDGLLLDGEVVVHDEAGRPSFQRLQGRAQLVDRGDIARAAVERPAAYYAFDLLAVEGWDLRGLPLLERKTLLRQVLPGAGAFRYVDHFPGQGEALFEQVLALGLEGIVAKRADSPYTAGRRSEWLKVHAPREGVFVVVGFTRPAGGRQGLGALHLAARADGDAPSDGPAPLLYAGKVGTGFTEADLVRLRETLEPLRCRRPACRGPLPKGQENVWVRPALACEVRYKEVTEGGALRAPVFLRMCDLPRDGDQLEAGRSGQQEIPAPESSPVRRPEPPIPEPELSNLDKLFWPEDGYTKGDLIEYYRSVAPFLLPYLRDRPAVLTRYPDGIHGKSFFQKNAPGHVPDWVRTEIIRSEGADRDVRYFVVQDEASLLYLANLGTIPLHLWASRIGNLDRPDWCVLDLDPKEAPFEDVIAIACALHDLCRGIGLPCFVKTSGSTGLHLLIPLDGQLGHGESRSLGELLARLTVAELPEIATVARRPDQRDGKVYVDYLQNGRGRLLAAPYSVRPLPGAPVSTPLRWREVRPGLDIRRYDIRRVPRRVRALNDDPLLPVLDAVPDLAGALARLERRLR